MNRLTRFCNGLWWWVGGATVQGCGGGWVVLWVGFCVRNRNIGSF